MQVEFLFKIYFFSSYRLLEQQMITFVFQGILGVKMKICEMTYCKGIFYCDFVTMYL
jgi:hypothetical protein